MNEYNLFKEQIKEIEQLNHKPSLLLHSCCGPCSSGVLDRLVPFFDITILYYNPNITPHEEFIKRYDVQQDLLNKHYPGVKLLMIDEPHELFEDAVKEYNTLPEGSMRCYKCYEFRIKYLAKYAEENSFDYFTTVMSVSPYKNSDYINEIGTKYQNKSKWLYSDFKKEEGYKLSCSKSKEYNLYRQDYCGCEYSIKEHEERVSKLK